MIPVTGSGTGFPDTIGGSVPTSRAKYRFGPPRYTICLLYEDQIGIPPPSVVSWYFESSRSSERTKIWGMGPCSVVEYASHRPSGEKVAVGWTSSAAYGNGLVSPFPSSGRIQIPAVYRLVLTYAKALRDGSTESGM